MRLNSRDELERVLGKALSRHIGYTTGAYDLGRILSVLEIFVDRPSVYKEEVTAFLSARAKVSDSRENSDNYFSEIVNFAQAMGLVETVSTREAGLQRLAATELGRSLLGAKATADDEFYRYFVARTVILADADALVCLLRYFSLNLGINLLESFVSFQTSLRFRRRDWLFSAFPEPLLLSRIASYISWLTPPKRRLSNYVVEIPTLNTARHHATPRQGWLQDLGMFDKANKRLTAFGEDALRALTPDGEYFWLAPPEGVEEGLRIAPANTAPYAPREDQLTFAIDARPPSPEEISGLVEAVSDIMLRGFDGAKLVHAAQASLRLPIEYILYRTYKDGIRYDWGVIIDEVFKTKRSILERYSAQKGKIGFYRRKAP